MWNKFLNSSNKTHAVLLVENKYVNIDKYIKNYVKSLICKKQKPFCNQCIYCEKVNQNKYFDMFYLNAFKNKILKDDINCIIKQFSNASVEQANLKFYIIRGVENLSKECANALLKFLEEPFPNTYAILTTSNINLVLPTIRSRAQVFHFKKNDDDLEQLAAKYKLNSQQFKAIISSITSLDDMENYLKTNKFFEDYQYVMKWISSSDISEIKSISDLFRKKEYFEIEKIILLIMGIIPNKKALLLKTIEKCKFQVSKILIFNEIWELLKN